jgi:hypothetical protein
LNERNAAGYAETDEAAAERRASSGFARPLWKSGDFVTEGTCWRLIFARADLGARAGGLAEAAGSHYLYRHESGAPWRRR